MNRGGGLRVGLPPPHAAGAEAAQSPLRDPLRSQILIQIVDASSVITWDFDVCKGDIVFNIYHSKRSPQPPKKDSLGAHSITSPGGNNVQLIDRVWQLGRDYSMVESPLICREGESVQVTPHTGHPSPPALSGAGRLAVGSS